MTKFYAIFDSQYWHESAYAIAKAIEDGDTVKAAVFTDNNNNKKASEDLLKQLGADIYFVADKAQTNEAKLKAVLPLAFKEKIQFIIIPTTLDSKNVDPIGATGFEFAASDICAKYVEDQLNEQFKGEQDPASKFKKIDEARDKVKVSPIFPNKFLNTADVIVRRRKYGLEKYDDQFKIKEAEPEASEASAKTPAENQPPKAAAPQ